MHIPVFSGDISSQNLGLGMGMGMGIFVPLPCPPLLHAALFRQQTADRNTQEMYNESYIYILGACMTMYRYLSVELPVLWLHQPIPHVCQRDGGT